MSRSKCNRQDVRGKMSWCGWIRASPSYETETSEGRGAAGQKPDLLKVRTRDDASVENSMSGHYSHTHAQTHIHTHTHVRKIERCKGIVRQPKRTDLRHIPSA